ncbi:MAG: MarR family transcriptional regulator [Thermomicrobiaceae bacterium]|nr:MarR family transcriptional regulator [Thermomicrobiaceae bacterium]
MPTGVRRVDYQRLAEFRYQIRRFLHFSEQAARAAGVEPQQHQALLAIKGMPEGRAATIQDVADRLQVRHHSAVGLIDRLAERGLVERSRSEVDRRQVLVRLTPAGEEILRELSLHHLAELRSWGPELVRTLTALLEPEERPGADGGRDLDGA